MVEIINPETTYRPNQGTELSLEFPAINSRQIQVITKDVESWNHYWTIPLMEGGNFNHFKSFENAMILPTYVTKSPKPAQFMYDAAE